MIVYKGRLLKKLQIEKSKLVLSTLVTTWVSNIAFHLRQIWLQTLVTIDSESHLTSFPSFCKQAHGTGYVTVDNRRPSRDRSEALGAIGSRPAGTNLVSRQRSTMTRCGLLYSVSGLWVKMWLRSKTACSEIPNWILCKLTTLQSSRSKLTTCPRKGCLLRFELNSTSTSDGCGGIHWILHHDWKEWIKVFQYNSITSIDLTSCGETDRYCVSNGISIQNMSHSPEQYI